MKINMKKLGFVLVPVAFAVAGYMAKGLLHQAPALPAPCQRTHVEAKQNSLWTCSMHPQIKQPTPGQCPICAMNLVELKTDNSSQNNNTLTLSQSARTRAQIEVSPVERKLVSKQIRMTGKVKYDETLNSFITARMPGRIERMFVNYTGITVKKGDHLFTIYSPELLTSQQELIQAIHSMQKLEQSSVEAVKQSATASVKAARQKLLLLGLTPKQVASVENGSKLTDHITVYSPVAGIITQKNATEGMYVEVGSRIYTIADLASVWVILNAYESDLIWLRFAQQVTFTTTAWPGRTFNARIAFIDPVVNEKTRTVKVRLNVVNTDGSLKPGMFVSASVNALIAKNGVAVSQDLAGKWISPMHPEIIKNAPGACDVCGMDLVPAEQLGFVNTSKTIAPLVVPDTAVMLTGKNAIVYVQSPGNKNSYEGRKIELGSKAEGFYVVESGLEEGELVVTNGAFKIDSELQIRAKTSMMNPENTSRTKKVTHKKHEH